MSYKRDDYYFKKAKADNFAARSVYKIEEIDQRFKLIKSGDQVLDLGCAPGSWSQYASQKIGKGGRILGIDLQRVAITLPNALMVEADFREVDLPSLALSHGFKPQFNLVLSDMAPKTTGIKFADQAKSLELCEIALQCATQVLTPGGHFVCKLFHSDDFKAFKGLCEIHFETVEVLKPKSVRQGSKEIFFIGIRRKNPI